jgi:hypothetical protein
MEPTKGFTTNIIRKFKHALRATILRLLCVLDRKMVFPRLRVHNQVPWDMSQTRATPIAAMMKSAMLQMPPIMAPASRFSGSAM